MKSTYLLRNPVARAHVAQIIMDLPDDPVHEIAISEAKRNSEQNSLLHAILADIAAQVEWHGQKFDVVTWKRLCMAAWLRERGAQPQLIPALDGHGFDVVFEHTAKLSVRECSELIEWCYAFGVEHEVKFRSPT